ncbi:NAD(P)-dependent alcohol dehydrogenase [Streptomyces sp. GQFP]|nr:NAD(P)-dependent alcohol dehydrogenase [Streptomyces sp. GQFP]UIX31985.1 NAD(P)-dependent alcohol dehydrogenase [Streptomyces sp. GQFP]
MRIQAALTESPAGSFAIRDVDLQAPRADEILVRITAAGLCHTDLSARAAWPEQLTPMVFGHEGTGVVETVGDEVTGLTPGDTVSLSFHSCGVCEPCTTGHPAYCTAFQLLNSSGGRADGTTPLSREGAPVFGGFFGQSSFATYAIAHERNAVRIPADLPAAVAAPLGCGVQTGAGAVLNVLRPAEGSSLVVVGAGGVGLSALMAAVAADCTPVIAVDPVASRRALAEELGAKATLDPTATEDIAAAIRDLTGGGAHHVVDTTGRPEMINQAVAALRPRGSLALVGMGTQVPLDIMPLLLKGISVHGVIEGDSDPAEFIPRLIELHRQGRLPVERLVTEFPFADIEAAATAMREGRAVKPVLTFG